MTACRYGTNRRGGQNRDAGTISRHHPSSFTSVSRKSSCRRGQLGSSSSQTKKALGICTSAQIPEAQANFFGKKKIPSQTSSPSFCLQGCRLSFPAIEDAPSSQKSVAESQKSHEEDDNGEGPREESEAADAGENDSSPPTRGQRYVFNRDFDPLPQSVQDEYTRVNNSRVFGKQQLLNKIINRAVRNRVGGYKAKVDTSSATGITNIIYG